MIKHFPAKFKCRPSSTLGESDLHRWYHLWYESLLPELKKLYSPFRKFEEPESRMQIIQMGSKSFVGGIPRKGRIPEKKSTEKSVVF